MNNVKSSARNHLDAAVFSACEHARMESRRGEGKENTSGARFLATYRNSGMTNQIAVTRKLHSACQYHRFTVACDYISE